MQSSKELQSHWQTVTQFHKFYMNDFKNNALVSGDSDTITVSDQSIEGIPVRVYKSLLATSNNKDTNASASVSPIIVYFHGSGW